MRQHIGTALKARSRAIRTALDKYNLAALAMVPPRQCLDWDEVVAYAFLSDFDLLRDTRQDIRTKPWATPAARLAVDQWFKLQRAEEEIKRLNVEIRRFDTYLHDEDSLLRQRESQISDPALAHQVWLYRMERGRFNAHHEQILDDVYDLPGCTATRYSAARLSNAAASDRPSNGRIVTPADDLDDDEDVLEQEQEVEDQEVDDIGALLRLFTMSAD